VGNDPVNKVDPSGLVDDGFITKETRDKILTWIYEHLIKKETKLVGPAKAIPCETEYSVCLQNLDAAEDPTAGQAICDANRVDCLGGSPVKLPEYKSCPLRKK